MRRKIGTLLDDEILDRAKRLSITKQVPLNRLIEDALQEYLEREAGEELLTLDEALSAEPASRSGEGKSRGAGDIHEDLG